MNIIKTKKTCRYTFILVWGLLLFPNLGIAQETWGVKNIQETFGKEYFLCWITPHEYENLEDNILIQTDGKYIKKSKSSKPHVYVAKSKYFVHGIISIGKKEYVRFSNEIVDMCIPVRYCQDHLCQYLIWVDFWEKEFNRYKEDFAYVDLTRSTRFCHFSYEFDAKILGNNKMIMVGHNRYSPIPWGYYEFNSALKYPIIAYLTYNTFGIDYDTIKLTFTDIQNIASCQAIISKSQYDSIVRQHNAREEQARREKQKRDSIIQREKFIEDSICIVRERLQNEIMETLAEKYPYGVAMIQDFSQNSVGGVNPRIVWDCPDSNVKVKYIEFTIKAYNKVDDIAKFCSPSRNATYKFAVGESIHFTGVGECTYYRDNIYKVVLQSCKIQTYDGKWHSIPINIDFKEQINEYVKEHL